MWGFYLLHKHTPQTFLGTPLTPQGAETGGAGGVLVAPHRTRVGRTRLYLVGGRVKQRPRDTVPVVDGNEAECPADLTCHMTQGVGDKLCHCMTLSQHYSLIYFECTCLTAKVSIE